MVLRTEQWVRELDGARPTRREPELPGFWWDPTCLSKRVLKGVGQSELNWMSDLSTNMNKYVCAIRGVTPDQRARELTNEQFVTPESARSWPMSTRTDQWAICDARLTNDTENPENDPNKFKKSCFAKSILIFAYIFWSVVLVLIGQDFSGDLTDVRRTDQRPREPGWQTGRELTNARGVWTAWSYKKGFIKKYWFFCEIDHLKVEKVWFPLGFPL